MTPFNFETVPFIVMQSGAAGRLGELLTPRFAVGRICVVTDPFLRDSGLIEPALSSLKAAGWSVLVMSDVQADPPDHVVESAVAQARDFGADVVLGLGGGSSMDVAKLVAVLLSGEQPLSEMYGIGQVRGKRVPLIQMPTTAGTGSEVTPIAIVTTGKTTKAGIVSPQLYADMAILDAELTLGLPAHITAATGIDAMVHAIEAYTSKRLKNPMADHLAVSALRLLSANLLQACEDGKNLAAREAMLLGAMLAGQAFANAPVAAVHALAYPLGGHFHIPHGLSNALVLPHVLRFNAGVAETHYAELGDALVPQLANQASAAEKTSAFIEYLEGQIAATRLPMRLRDHGIGEGDLALLAADAMLQTRLLTNNPRELVEADALAIYQRAL